MICANTAMLNRHLYEQEQSEKKQEVFESQAFDLFEELRAEYESLAKNFEEDGYIAEDFNDWIREQI